MNKADYKGWLKITFEDIAPPRSFTSQSDRVMYELLLLLLLLFFFLLLLLLLLSTFI